MKTPLALTLLSLSVALAGCGGPDTTKGGLSAEEERRLDDAAKMLDDNMANLPFDSAAENGAAGNNVAGNSSAGR